MEQWDKNIFFVSPDFCVYAW